MKRRDLLKAIPVIASGAIVVPANAENIESRVKSATAELKAALKARDPFIQGFVETFPSGNISFALTAIREGQPAEIPVLLPSKMVAAIERHKKYYAEYEDICDFAVLPAELEYLDKVGSAESAAFDEICSTKPTCSTDHALRAEYLMELHELGNDLEGHRIIALVQSVA